MVKLPVPVIRHRFICFTGGKAVIMKERKYKEDWVNETRFDDKGREKRVPVYRGDWFGLAPGQVKRRLLAEALLPWVGFIALVLLYFRLNFPGSTVLYVFLPAALSLFPALYWVLGIAGFFRAGEKMTRLQSMIQSAEDVSDLIDIESAIADTQYYIDRYTGQLKSYDGKVDYSTVSVSVREVKITEMKEVTLGERILNGLSDSLESGREFLEDMAVFLVSALPWLAVLAIAALVVRLIVKKKKNGKDDTK